MCEAAVIGFMYANAFDQVVSVSWYYPPEEWKPLDQWHGETTQIFQTGAPARGSSMTDNDRLVILILESAGSVRLQKLLRHTEQTGRSISEIIAATGIDLEEIL